MNPYTYPAAPDSVVSIPVSTNFKSQATKVVGSIALFCIVYLALVGAVLVLAFAAAYYGLALIIGFPRWITLLLGAGMIATGISLVFFVVKFIGSVTRKQQAGMWQVSENEHPALFDFLRRVAAETQTPFPKKVFISPDVNAAVFYDSSFLSMFMPVKKNLVVGLGLVNAVNLSEFKAVIAHEFGHFSQRSMKVGSYAYHVNLIIYNMLYENTSYSNFLNRWGSLHGLLAIFANITVKISLFIQWILRGMYGLINKHYLALSREMEYHADAIAASVAGGNNLVTALSRFEIADSCYEKAIQHANEFIGEQKQVSNIFLNQTLLYQLAGKQFRLPIANGLPEISYQFATSMENSRINIKNQWASHPTLTERKKHLDLFNINVAPLTSSPWILFNDPELVQQQVTTRLYEAVSFENKPEIIDFPAYELWLDKRKESKQLPVEYNGFYDNRYPALSEDDIQQVGEISYRSFTNIFSEENGKLQSLIQNNRRDLELVQAIHDKRIDVKSFDFDGEKFLAHHCDLVIERLQADLKNLEEKQKELDKEAFAYFHASTENPEALRLQYMAFFEDRKSADAYAATSNEIAGIIQRISDTVSLEQANAEAQRLKEIDKTIIKPALANLLGKKVVTPESNQELYNKAVAFQEKEYHYFSGNSFLENEIADIYALNTLISDALVRHQFTMYKSLLNFQLESAGKPPATGKVLRMDLAR